MAPLQRPLRVATDCSGMETPLMALAKLQAGGFEQGDATN